MRTDDTAWFCVQTQNKQERAAAGSLRRLNDVEVFHPRFSTRQLVGERVMRVTESLFPNYLFACFAFPGQLNEVRYTAGVKDVVHFNDRWPTVPDAIVEGVRRSLKGEFVELTEALLVGEQVVIAVGACFGQTATVQSVMPARRRIQVLFDILGRNVSLELSLDQVVRVETRPPCLV
jgi:transcriptional antiterminator RfaH